jgi:hypothetical protein
MSQLTTLALVCVLIAGCGTEPRGPLAWGIGVTSFDSAELGLGVAAPDPLADVAAIRRLTIPTYDGSGQAVHPDLLREPDRLLMAITPYPYSDDRFENPSLIVSTDGTQFSELSDGLNPLVEAPAIDHNDDPDLHVDPATGEYEILYLETLRPDTQHLISLRSRDLVTWTRTTAIDWNLAAGASFVVSPAVLVHGGTTSLFDVVLVDDGSRIERNDSVDGKTWNGAQGFPVVLETGGMVPWHMDVFAHPNGYGMLINGYFHDINAEGNDLGFNNQDLWLATSSDLIHWSLRSEPLLKHDDPDLDLSTVYRSTGFVAGDRLVIWYSHQYRE